jgi:uncharacterized NAD(P)/FAD-binding protein YdhS
MIRCDVAIIGGGLSGALVAAQLARRGSRDLAACLFEESDVGRGAAYGTRHVAHLLNTRAGAMTAFPDDPDHFVRWLGSRGSRNDFVSRRLYGDYLAELTRQTLEQPRFTHVKARIAGLARTRDGGFLLETAPSRTRYEARCVVLATGNALPSEDVLPRAAIEHPGYVADPWRFDYRCVGGHVLLVGSGLTALDVLVALESCGHRGAVHVVSRRGRFPEVHADRVASYDAVPALDTSNARAVLRSVRRHVRDAQARGIDWRAVVDAIRPESELVWRRLSPVERGRFDRHLRALWERHRHRAPQPVDAVRDRYEKAGRLFAYRGEVAAFHAGVARIVPAQGEPIELRPDWIVNCTGPGRPLADPLLAGMLRRGIATPDPLGRGIRVNGGLSPIDAADTPVRGLWVVGPLARGSRFEATAVPELRTMAQAVAGDVLEALSQDDREKANASRYFYMALPLGDLSHMVAALPVSP